MPAGEQACNSEPRPRHSDTGTPRISRTLWWLSLPTTLTHRVLTTMTQGSRSRRVHSTLVVYVFKPSAVAAAGAGSEDAASARVARQGAGVSGSSRPR